MINRQNWIDTKKFLEYHQDTLQNDNLSIKMYRGCLRHLLEWADEKLLTSAKNITPAFPAYLAQKKKYSSHYTNKVMTVAREFFNFSKGEWRSRYGGLNESWIQTLRPSKRNGAQSQIKEHLHYTLEDVLKIARLETHTLEDQRDVAAVCFLFLSGMRIAAFTTLPIECVKLEENSIYQLPEKGVLTKNRKAAITYLLPIPELLQVVNAWDARVRKELTPSDLWYPVMEIASPDFAKGRAASRFRGDSARMRIKDLCRRAGIKYLSPHKLRHGHVVYGLKKAKDIEEMKAVSQNVMHSSLQITDAIYGQFSSGDVKRVISAIGSGKAGEVAREAPDMQPLISLFSALLKDNPEAMKLLATFGKQTNP